MIGATEHVRTAGLRGYTAAYIRDGQQRVSALPSAIVRANWTSYLGPVNNLFHEPHENAALRQDAQRRNRLAGETTGRLHRQV